ncbi:hypothetical protein BC834DRAFT_876336 [Gloeopeniophorella convolvens]|nr:hypothetical protein BC834DRAFT_876336 [Gloeopeniophorella convolvens]
MCLECVTDKSTNRFPVIDRAFACVSDRSQGHHPSMNDLSTAINKDVYKQRSRDEDLPQFVGALHLSAEETSSRDGLPHQCRAPAHQRSVVTSHHVEYTYVGELCAVPETPNTTKDRMKLVSTHAAANSTRHDIAISPHLGQTTGEKSGNNLDELSRGRSPNEISGGYLDQH